MKLPFIEAKPTTGKKFDKFVGLKIKGNEIYFYYPQTLRFDKNSDSASLEILKFLETFRLSDTFADDKTAVCDINDGASLFPVSSSLWIIRDYLENGLYVNEDAEFRTRDKGRINWKRTLESTPIITENTIFYKDLVIEAKTPIEDIIVLIFQICVKKSLELLGWLFNLNPRCIDSKPFNERLKPIYSNILFKELVRTFNDEQRIRLAHMKNIIDGLNPMSGAENTLIYGINNFHHVFEKMIDGMFGTEKDLTDFYPNADWHVLLPKKDDFPSSDLRPDTIMIHDDIYILDAKFYQYGFTANKKDLPSTTSIHKQITYGEFIKTNNKKHIKNVYNAFILPYDKENNHFGLNDNLVYFANATANWKTGETDYMIVHAFLIDLKHLIDNWNRNNSADDIKKMIDSIKKANDDRKKAMAATKSLP